MRTADLISDTFPHGTVDGNRAGCRTSACPAPLPCRDVARRYAGDYGFRRLVDAGVPLADIVAQEDAERGNVEQRDRAANRAAQRAARKRKASEPGAAPAPAEPTKPPVAAPTPAPAPAPVVAAPTPDIDIERAAAAWRVQRLALDLTLRNAERAVDAAIAARDRAEQAYNAHVAAGEPTAASASPRNGRRQRRDEIEAGVRRLHAEGKSDAVMSVALKITRAYVGMVRRDLGLASNVPAGGQKAAV
jgi:hypothetical protein